MDKEQAIVVDVPNTLVREISYTYMGARSIKGEVFYMENFVLHLELDSFEVLPDGTHRLYWAKDGRTITVRPAWIYWSEIVRPAKRTVMGKADAQKPTVVN